MDVIVKESILARSIRFKRPQRPKLGDGTSCGCTSIRGFLRTRESIRVKALEAGSFSYPNS